MGKRIFILLLSTCLLLAGCTPIDGEGFSASLAENSSTASINLEESQDDSSSLWSPRDPNAVVELIEHRGPSYYDAKSDPNEITIDYGDTRIKVPGFTRKDNISDVFISEMVAAVTWYPQNDSLSPIWVMTSGDQGGNWITCKVPSDGMEHLEHLSLSYDQNGDGLLMVLCQESGPYFFRTQDMGNTWALDKHIHTPDICPFEIDTFTNGTYIYNLETFWQLQEDGSWRKVPLPEITESGQRLQTSEIKSDGKITLIMMIAKSCEGNSWDSIYFVSEDDGKSWHHFIYE